MNQSVELVERIYDFANAVREFNEVLLLVRAISLLDEFANNDVITSAFFVVEWNLARLINRGRQVKFVFLRSSRHDATVRNDVELLDSLLPIADDFQELEPWPIL